MKKTAQFLYSFVGMVLLSQTALSVASPDVKPDCLTCRDSVTGAAMACSSETKGKRIDNSRVYLEILPPNSERNVPFGTSFLGSSVLHRKPVADRPSALIPPASTAMQETVILAGDETQQDAKGKNSDAYLTQNQPSIVANKATAAKPVITVSGDLPSPDMVVRISDSLTAAMFVSGKDRLLPQTKKVLDELVVRLKGKRNLRLETIGHTDSVRVALRDTVRDFGTNQRLSEARARAVARYLQKSLNIPEQAVGIIGRADREPIADNRTAIGRAKNRRTEIAFWYDDDSITQVEPLQQPEAAAISVKGVSAASATEARLPAVVPLSPSPPLPLKSQEPMPVPPAGSCGDAGQADLNRLPFRVTIDGKPVTTDKIMPEADRQRCVDVALEKADIQLRYDPLQVKPALNSWSYPDAPVRGTAVEFGAYANYQAWIKNAEIRVFAGPHATGKPLAVITAAFDRMTVWSLPLDSPDEITYLLRVYDREGRFDETAAKRLRVLSISKGEADLDLPKREKMTGWGEDSRKIANIPVAGGTVTVNAKGLKSGETVKTLGAYVPVDKNGSFAMRQIFPSGPHTAVIEVTEPDGAVALYTRNFTIPDEEWFYVAIADLTVGQNRTTGPAEMVTADSTHYDNKTYVDGRGAFYLKGKIKGEYLLTASADTREQPFENLFSNFDSKDPKYLLKRINPDLYYPVYGDDSTVFEDAPTMGKFYVRLEKGDSHVLWGNFQTGWTGNELTQYSRSLYGASLRLKSPSITRYGERTAVLDGFASEPGTLSSRDEFRGTGGSLYYLRHLDITVASERVWIEVRDRDSGMVLERKQMVPAQDYDLNSIQGRILLRSPLPSVTTGAGLISTGSPPGNPVFMVVTYEYAPGTTAVDGYAFGGDANWWITEHLRFGMTGYRAGKNSQEQTLYGANAIIRLTPETFVKTELAHSSGPGANQQNSISGGFDFNRSSTLGERAEAQRIEGQINFADIAQDLKGKAGMYWQHKDKGFSGPGELTPGEKVNQIGGRMSLPIGKSLEVEIKGDDRDAASQSTSNIEGALHWNMLPEWQLSTAVRNDARNTATPNASATLSENGERTDVQARIHYRPLLKTNDSAPAIADSWDIYSLAQLTASRSGNRRDNNRGGLGGGWQATDRLHLGAEATAGDNGPAGLFKGDYRISDRSSVYLGYTMETERPDSNSRGRYDTAVAGSKYRVSDQMSLYGETKSTHGAGAESLVHAFGLDLSPDDRWSYGLKGEWGTISDPAAGDLKRQAAGVSVGYKKDKTKYAGNLEYRHEDGTTSNRDVWLVRNALSYQVDSDWRWFNKVNFSVSSNSKGAFYDGDFVEIVSGGAFRPVKNDRWNALCKYTYFQDTPTAGQVTSSNQIADYSQRSHVIDADLIYDLFTYLSVGGKAGYRYSMLKPNKVSGDWFASHAMLGILRTDIHFIRQWDILAEARVLKVSEANDRKSGFLTAIYYHIDKNIKAGAGYNFTDFSDNMTDLSYRSRGWFINMIAKY